MSVSNYLDKVAKHYNSGHATEHTYRGDFAELINTLVSNIHITNEPSNVTNCGNPDYVITRNKIPVGFIEAKDLGKDLNSKQYKEQFGRYRKALDNLIITDYVWFQFFQNGKLVHEIRIAEIDGKDIKPIPENFAHFSDLINDFCTFIAQTIKSPKALAEMMAAKARLLENILENAITSDEENEENSALKQQYETFKNILIHDLSPQGFSDIYAQTLAYGMFAARLHDKTLDTFSRQEAAELIPKSNPFLRKLFSHVAGVDIDERIVTTVDNLADVFRATNVEALLKNFGKSTQSQDPIIHFYETFLAEYDPKLRKARGVWYTPEPVVKFIVRGVDEILKSEFGLRDGLADTSKTTIKLQTDQPDRRTKSGYVEIDKEVHRVQVLDPATGTGTFLAEVVKYIYGKKFITMQGAWSSYVEEHLVPRLNGFELLMASYSMAHLKLDMLLTETGYQSKRNPRFNIFLTNSLEEYHPDTGTLFSSWLSTEANEANSIKRDTPVMVVMGNPPYSGESANKGAWIMDLMEDYKKEPGGKEKLKEKNSKWINNDYVKFMRYGQEFIEERGEGVLAFINPHGFLDNPTFRGMRWNLLKTYDKIFTIDLHGHNKKEEIAPDGSVDENVFDILEGVSINFLIKTGRKKKNDLAEVHHFDLYGKRKNKYEYLNNACLFDIDFKHIKNVSPMYYMCPKNYDVQEEYDLGVSLQDMFIKSSTGIVTARDKFTIHRDKESVRETIDKFLSLDDEAARVAFELGKDVRDWKVSLAKKDILDSGNGDERIVPIDYRPFDNRFTYYTGNSKGFHCMPRGDLMKHMLPGGNLALMSCRQTAVNSWEHVGVTKTIVDDSRVSNRSRERGYIYPIFLYPDNNSEKVSNFSKEALDAFEKALSLTFTFDGHFDRKRHFSSHSLFDYIYAVLHNPKYRLRYKEFLMSDFPKIPIPKTQEKFWILADKGEALRQAHLLEAEFSESSIASYPEGGSNEVTRGITKKDWDLYDKENQTGRVWINDEQYFERIPIHVWNLYIGGYQPAQKWLKDRKGTKLKFDDILHYQRVLAALSETIKITKELEFVDI